MAGQGAHGPGRREAITGYLLIAAAVSSFVLLNSPAGPAFKTALDGPFAPLGLGAGPAALSLHVLINDGLMAVFFLNVGLELKREMIEGPLRSPQRAALPLAGALGGMAAPALVYLAVTGGDPAYARGWAIPMATDIAFALGVLSLLGARAPASLRLFLLALAVLDDLGAIAVIALFYTQDLAVWALAGAGAAFLGLLTLNRAGVRALAPYWILGAVMWVFMLASGVHATMAGVLLAAAIPFARADGRSPLRAAEAVLTGWTQLAIMPVFALANAGVRLEGAEAWAGLAHPVALGVGAGLVLGKPLGIVLATLGAARLLRRPPPAPLLPLVGVSAIAGIGFTMGLFIGGLAFQDGPLAGPVRFGVLGGSILSATLGLLLLRFAPLSVAPAPPR